MIKYRKIPVEIEAITFSEFIEYGRLNCSYLVNGMPWSFYFKGFPVTNENGDCYLIPTKQGTKRFTPHDMLIIDNQGDIYPCKKDLFTKTYEEINR